LIPQFDIVIAGGFVERLALMAIKLSLVMYNSTQKEHL
jgi:hypothetical protein